LLAHLIPIRGIAASAITLGASRVGTRCRQGKIIWSAYLDIDTPNYVASFVGDAQGLTLSAWETGRSAAKLFPSGEDGKVFAKCIVRDRPEYSR
jgi:hypothetical protein